MEFVVRSSLLALCIAGGLFVLRVRAARVRHAVWTSVVVLMLLMPLWMEWGPKAEWHVLTPPAAAAVVEEGLEPDLSLAVAAPVVAPPSIWTARNAVFAVYLLGLGFFLMRLLTGTVRARLIARRATNRGGRLTSDACLTPITVGVLRPSVILPAGWIEWPPAQLGAVLAHEEAHVRRRDPLVQWVALFNRAVFWFHPLAWWLEKHLSGLAEEACDDAVLMRGQDPMEYSEVLLGMARVVRESGSRVRVMGMAMPGTFLPERIRRIAGGVEMQKISSGRMVSLIGVCAAVSIVFTAGALGYEPAVPQAAPTTMQAEVAPAVTVRQPIVMQKEKTKPKLVAQATSRGLPSIAGTVVDPANLTVAGAAVTLLNPDSGTVLSTVTDSAGVFKLAGFPAGTYSLTVKVPGFKALTREGIQIAPIQELGGMRMMLQLGGIAESLTVNGSKSAPVVMPAPRPAGEVRPAIEPSASPAVPDGTGGHVVPTAIVSEVKPVYPVEMQRQGVAGTVKVVAVIGKDGHIVDVRIREAPDRALAQASFDAISQWRYRPTLLNGVPVEVISNIDVNFELGN